MALTRVSPALFQVSNNITSVTVGGSANTISLTFDSNGVITGATNNAVSVANTAITGNIVSSQITSVANTQITGTITGSQISSNTLSNTVFQTGSVENYMRTNNLDFGMRNRIINGAMVIDQRNAGAALTVNSGTDFFAVDRFLAVGTASSGVFTVQRSSTAPTGFINSLAATVTTADASLAATDQYYVSQIIEGLNVADLAWGTASAATVTLSFWVHSSLTGTFGGAIRNSAQNRSYPFTYTISSANTWEQKTVTIAGDTSGTWLTTNGKGLDITWTLGLGSTYSGTAGAWAAANYKGASGVTNVMATNGATFYITGVQLEKGSTATSFDYRPYSAELAMCQRYYWEANQTTYNTNTWATGANSPSHNLFTFRYPVEMRTAPTAGIAGVFSVYSAASVGTRSSIATSQIGTQSSRILFTLVGSSGNSCWIDSDSNASKLTFSAEL